MIAGEPFPLFPFVDGTLLTQTMNSAFASGQFNQVPVLTGTTQNEYNLFVAENYDLQGNPILTSGEYTSAVENLFGPELSPYVLGVYLYSNYPTGGQAFGAAATDGIFSCPESNAVQLLSNYVNTYAYEFNDVNAPPAQADFGGALTFPLGAYHTSELQYLFKQWDVFGLPTTLSASQGGLSKRMRLYWTQFAKTGNPNVAPEPNWPTYNSSANFLSLVEPKPAAISYFSDEHLCPVLWSQIP
jgi:para-nitrobenzyl esterase